MRFDPNRWTHTGVCPMCKRSTKANVHQSCGLAREAALKAKRAPRLPLKAMTGARDDG